MVLFYPSLSIWCPLILPHSPLLHFSWFYTWMDAGHSFNITRFTKESIILPLYLPLAHAHLIFTPGHFPDESSLGPFDPKPPRGPVQLIREGQITDHDLHYRGIISLSRNGSIYEVVIARLTSRHDGLYEVKDRNGNLVSSTYLHVISGYCATFLEACINQKLFDP